MTNWNYGNQGGQDLYGNFDNTKPIEDRDPFIPEGRHRLCLVRFEEYVSQDKGPAVRASFEVLASDTARVGSFCTKLWFITKPSKFPWQATDADRLADFARKLKGETNPAAPMGASLRTLLKDRANEQLARGTVIDAFGRNTSKKADKPFVDVTWTIVEQSEADVVKQRTRLEQSGIAARYDQRFRGGGQQQYAAPQPAWNPNMQAPAQAYDPRQAAMPNNFGSPGGIPASGQGFVPPAPQQMPQQQQYAPPPAQPSPAPAPQQGGFLAQIPPQQGGNGGGGRGW